MLRGIPRGHYRVRWRLKFQRDAYGLDNVEFSARVYSGRPPYRGYKAITAKMNQLYREHAGRDWFYYDLPEVLDVGTQEADSEYFDLTVELMDRSGNWKGGMSLDFVELVKV